MIVSLLASHSHEVLLLAVYVGILIQISLLVRMRNGSRTLRRRAPPTYLSLRIWNCRRQAERVDGAELARMEVRGKVRWKECESSTKNENMCIIRLKLSYYGTRVIIDKCKNLFFIGFSLIYT